MSTFPGTFEEIKSVSIDRFDRDNIHSTMYFLSHFHADHMNGLYEYVQNRSLLNRSDVFLYSSPLTVALLENKYPQVKNKFKSLEIGPTHCLTVPDTDEIVYVTLLLAGHCPGSVMFLFETERRVLYTGDIRLRVNEIQKFTALHDMSGNVKRIDKIYLDTTFFSKSYENFPPREESLKEFLNELSNWLKDEKKQVKFELPYNYGVEYLYIEVFKALKKPIHVSKMKHDVYKHIPELDNVTTTDSKKSRIHSYCRSWKEYCFDINKFEFYHFEDVLTVKTSCLRWIDWDFKKGMIEKESPNKIYVCYASHCSYSELVDILHYLKPIDIYPSVLPSISEPDVKEKTEKLFELIEATLKDIHRIEEPTNEKPQPKWLLPESSSESELDDTYESSDNRKNKKSKFE